MWDHSKSKVALFQRKKISMFKMPKELGIHSIYLGIMNIKNRFLVNLWNFEFWAVTLLLGAPGMHMNILTIFVIHVLVYWTVYYMFCRYNCCVLAMLSDNIQMWEYMLLQHMRWVKLKWKPMHSFFYYLQWKY
jgi:hypothetical protein